MKWIELETVLKIHNQVIESTGGALIIGSSFNGAILLCFLKIPMEKVKLGFLVPDQRPKYLTKLPRPHCRPGSLLL